MKPSLDSSSTSVLPACEASLIRRGRTLSVSRSCRVLVLSSCLLVAPLGVRPAAAQFLRRPVALEGARIQTMAGPDIARGTVLMSGDPLDPASRVLRVFVGGEQVFESTE